jgi:hypothetical protein
MAIMEVAASIAINPQGVKAQRGRRSMARPTSAHNLANIPFEARNDMTHPLFAASGRSGADSSHASDS